MKNILLALDNLKKDKLLVEKAGEFAKSFNAKLWLVHIAPPDPDFVGLSVGPKYIRDEKANKIKQEHKQLQEYANKLSNDGIDSEGLLIQGATVEIILKEAKNLNVKLIIAGHREHSFLFDALYGSTSKSILKKTNIPILIVPLNE